MIRQEVTTVEITRFMQRPSAPPVAWVPAPETLAETLLSGAACTLVAHEPFVGHIAAWTQPATAPFAQGGKGISVSTARYRVGATIPTTNGQLTGDVRGIPPRGSPT